MFESVINRYMSNYHGADHSATAGHEAAASDAHANVEHATARPPRIIIATVTNTIGSCGIESGPNLPNKLMS